MKRTQIQLDEGTYEALRRQAYQQGCSISALIRNTLAKSLKARRSKRRLSIKHFTFIDAGHSQQGQLAPVSEHHDDALAESLVKRHRL